MASGFKVADAFIEVHLDDSTAKREVSQLPQRIGTDTDRAGTTVGRRMGQSVGKGLTPEADRAGRQGGDKLAQGMNLAIVRNSPLIAAAAGGALAAGAPAVIAGAGLLFAGIGVAAAAMNDEVQHRWSVAWQSIVTGTKADATVLQSTVAGMADQVGRAFEEMRPLMRDAFTSLAPILHDFTASILQAAQNALPGLVHAVQAGAPVFAGLGSLVESIGTGLGKFFDIISQHSSAAGNAFAAIGDIVGALLPMLGDLLGQGAELASVVLPPLAAVLGVVADVLHAIAPVLPAVAAGFGAFKIVSLLTGPLGSLADNLTKFAQNAAFASYQGGLFGKAAGGISTAAAGGATALSKVGSALPVVGAALGLLSAGLMEQERQITSWAQALLDGGVAADHARSEMAKMSATAEQHTSGFMGLIGAITGTNQAYGIMGNAVGDVDDKQKELLASMTPLERAQQAVTTAQNELSQAVERYGPSSLQANEAAQAYKDAQAEVENQSSRTQLAIDGVTDAMIAQADQAMAMIDSSFAYQNSLDQLEDKQKALNDAIRDHGAASEEASDAQRDYAEGLWQTAQNAGRLAADQSGLTQGTAEYNRTIQNETLKALYDLRQGLGPDMQAAVDTMIHTLEAGGASLDEIGQYHPTPTVGVDTGPLDTGIQGALGHLFNLSQQHPVPIADLDTNPFAGKHATAIAQVGQLAGQRPTPTLDANAGPFAAQANWAMGTLGQINSSRPSPIITAYAYTANAENQINYAARSRTAYINVIGKSVLASGGPVTRAASGRVVGPGTGTSDSVPAVGPGGSPWALSDGEWVIKESAVAALERAFGKGAMPTINSGQLPTMAASGRGVGSDGAGTVTAGGNTFHITVNAGMGADGQEIGRVTLRTIQQGLLRLEREVR